ncbi:Histone-lysine N-methyltransferase MLL4 [Morus notabilis]|uniref:Histone-lysine N-methyltransferase MLL4 n=1 Tax=Morus notabilis TaxID=981085 RepID=W9QFC2_9ROSA|nr:Histone-lysine N-methyltransferase MLL4 [Morus notabilis]
MKNIIINLFFRLNRRICFCPLGFPRSHGNGFLDEVRKVEEFLKDPWGIRVRDGEKGAATVQVAVPRIVPPPPPPPQPVLPPPADAVDEEAAAAAAAASAQAKRAALQRKAAAAMVAAEDYARRFESGDLMEAPRGPAGEEQGQSNISFIGVLGRVPLAEFVRYAEELEILTNLCSVKGVMVLTIVTANILHIRWNVSSGPYLCPKHTKCHSCGSTVPGNGLSVRWFLGYTCCDACGRLFVKGNYCPVCLKVYRDSESTPMVCCDICQRWVHCQCDGISDEKYLQFQVDGNLQYKCATCRGECYQVKDLEDAVKELWRRKDKADRDLIVRLRAAAGLPTQEEIFSISPYSDDEENGPVAIKNEYGRTLKLSLKGLADNSPKKTKDFGKKYSSKASAKKKGYQAPAINKREPDLSFEGQNAESFRYNLGRDKNGGLLPQKDEVPETYSSPVAGSLSHTEEICSINQPGVLKHKFVDEVMVSDEDRTSRVVRIKSNKSNDVDSGEDTGKHSGKSKTVKGKKLVINLGARKINVTNSPRSDASTGQREHQEFVASNGGEDTSWRRTNDNKHDAPTKYSDGFSLIIFLKFGTFLQLVERNDYSGQSMGLKVGSIKLGKIRTAVSDYNPKFGQGSGADPYETATPEQTHTLLGRAVPTSGSERVYSRKHSERRAVTYNENNGDYGQTPVSHSLPKDPKPLLKFKFKKPSTENQNSANQEEEKSSIKGQRSKRKRPSPFLEKLSISGADATQAHQDNLMDEIMDANWILKKLGKDAIGKRVEVHQQSDNSWHKGMVADVVDGASTVSVVLDDGRQKLLELGKQGVRFVSQKQKRSKT